MKSIDLCKKPISGLYPWGFRETKSEVMGLSIGAACETILIVAFFENSLSELISCLCIEFLPKAHFVSKKRTKYFNIYTH